MIDAHETAEIIEDRAMSVAWGEEPTLTSSSEDNLRASAFRSKHIPVRDREEWPIEGRLRPQADQHFPLKEDGYTRFCSARSDNESATDYGRWMRAQERANRYAEDADSLEQRFQWAVVGMIALAVLALWLFVKGRG